MDESAQATDDPRKLSNEEIRERVKSHLVEVDAPLPGEDRRRAEAESRNN